MLNERGNFVITGKGHIKCHLHVVLKNSYNTGNKRNKFVCGGRRCSEETAAHTATKSESKILVCMQFSSNSLILNFFFLSF